MEPAFTNAGNGQAGCLAPFEKHGGIAFFAMLQLSQTGCVLMASTN
jgi:hypothetical protein